MRNVQENVRDTGESQCEDAVLEGHLGLARELLSFVSPEKKHELGCQGGNLIRVSPLVTHKKMFRSLEHD
jgi:ubiquitin carboxyl-terminal hydrolase 9/24